MIHENLSSFYGMTVKDYSPELGAADASRVAYRFRIDWEAYENDVTFGDLFDQYLSDIGAADTRALVIGDWGGTGEGNDASTAIKALAAAADRLPKLKALFIGDLIGEESEISWINQADVAPILAAFPALEELGVRGGEGLAISKPEHATLRKLVIETGGLPRSVVQSICKANFPELTHLELWLGVSDYGGDTTVDDLQPLLASGLFPKLTYLGLRNSELADEIAKALPAATVVNQLEVLDLSLGTLTDEGVAAMAASNALRGLSKLDIHHHFASSQALAALEGLGIGIDASDVQTADEYDGEIYRYVYAAE